MVESGQLSFRNRSVDQSHFAMVPRADIPRSSFRVSHTHKTTINLARLIPIYVNEVLPGDSFRVSMTAFGRLATPVFPIMDNMKLESFFFFVPNRLVWTHWQEFITGDQTVAYVVPRVTLSTAVAAGSVFDYMGIPVGNLLPALGGDQFTQLKVNALPFRGYQLVYNEWFRDQNLQAKNDLFLYGDGPDVVIGTFAPIIIGKRHDYFTSCLPWPQDGAAVALPLGTRANVRGIGLMLNTSQAGPQAGFDASGAVNYSPFAREGVPTAGQHFFAQVKADGAGNWWPDIYADLSTATAASINALREAFAVQGLLERDARGGSRYTESLLAHFGVTPQDSRLQRPEYIGGGVSDVLVSPIAQTSATGLTGGASPLGALGGAGTSVARHSFSYSAQEHGFIIGMITVREDLTYQQGLERFWSRQTRYDYYWPAFAHLGEQSVLRKELYATGDPANDDVVFGYQERWAEYRYKPSMISGKFRSKAASNIDEWHLAEEFASAPSLNSTFISDPLHTVFQRVAAAGAATAAQLQMYVDTLFDQTITRAMPTYSVPGFMDRF